MNKKIIVLLLSVVLVGSVGVLILYNIGGYVLNAALEISETVSAAEAPGCEASQFPAVPEQEDIPPAPPSGSMETEAAAQAEPDVVPDVVPDVAPEVEHTAQVIPEQATQDPSTNGDETDLHYASEQIERIEDSVSPADRITASVLVLSKLSTEDIQYLYGLLKNGLTPEEKAEAKAICYARFNEEEIAQIYALYQKYGK